MAKKMSMMINADHPEVCRAVILEDGKVQDYIVENVSHEKIKGNIYLGVINRIEPAIEAAFIDFGGKKYGFLPFKDVLKETYVNTGEKRRGFVFKMFWFTDRRFLSRWQRRVVIKKALH